MHLKRIAALMFAGVTLMAGCAYAQDKPTIVLVHGAFAESNSWDGVITKLKADGYPVIGAANPLRGVRGDAQAVSAVVKAIKGPVILVGHSYGGNVITNVDQSAKNIKGLVFVSAFALEAGETTTQLSRKFPGSTLVQALAPPVVLPDGSKDLYIRQEAFHTQLAADIPAAAAALMAAAQRPIAQAALVEASGAPLWKQVPSWFVYGDADKSISVAALAWMAERAGSKHTVVVEGASHVVMVSHPSVVADLIEQAALHVGTGQ